MDIRQLYNSLSPEDKALYQKIRTDIRKVYLNAHTNIVTMNNWNEHDDAFMDLLDIKIASLFDRAGFIEGLKPVVNKEETEALEKNINDKDASIKAKMNTEMSVGSQDLKANGALAKW